MLGLSLGVAQSEPTSRESFDHGVREYDARRFARAERFFAEAARVGANVRRRLGELRHCRVGCT